VKRGDGWEEKRATAASPSIGGSRCSSSDKIRALGDAERIVVGTVRVRDGAHVPSIESCRDGCDDAHECGERRIFRGGGVLVIRRGAETKRPIEPRYGLDAARGRRGRIQGVVAADAIARTADDAEDDSARLSAFGAHGAREWIGSAEGHLKRRR
jgi:hypothetical protein